MRHHFTHKRHSNRGSRLRTLRASVLALTGLVALGGLPAATLSATATEPSPVIQPGIEFDGVLAYGRAWLGAVVGPPSMESNQLAWCTQSGLHAPVGIDGEPHTVAGGPSDLGQSIRVSASELAAIIEVHGPVEEALSRAAISFLVHTNFEDDTAALPARDRVARYEQHTPAEVKSLAAQFAQEAAAYAGPFTAAPTSMTLTAGGRGTITGIGVQGARGGFVGGVQTTIRLTGPATFDASGTQELSFISAASAQDAAWTAHSSGEIAYTIDYAGLRRSTLTKFVATTNGYQNTLSTSHRPPSDPTSLSDQGNLTVWLPFLPTISTRMPVTSLEKGDAALDSVTVGTTAGDTWAQGSSGGTVPVVVTGTLYGPMAAPPQPSAQVPAGTPVAATARFTAPGPGTYSAGEEVAVAASGYYTWVWGVLRAQQPGDVAALLRGDVSDVFAAPEETAVVRLTPALTTERSDRSVLPGSEVSDSVAVALGEGDVWPLDAEGDPVNVELAGTLYGPFPEPLPEQPTAPGDAPVAAEVSLSVDRAGEHEAPSVTVQEPGFYTWVWRIAEHSDALVTQVPTSDAFMVPFETFSVLRPLSHTSQIVLPQVEPGGRLIDTITVDGFPSEAFTGAGEWVADAAEATVTVYGPLSAPPDTADVPADAPVFWTGTLPARNGTHVVGGREPITLPESVTHADGDHFVVVYSFAGDDRTAPFTSAFNDPAEMVTVVAPPPPVEETPPLEAAPPRIDSLPAAGLGSEIVPLAAGIMLVGSGLVVMARERRPRHASRRR